MSSAMQCRLCGEAYSVLRHSSVCDLCHQTACSSCCRSLPNNPKAKMCINCARKQKKAEDPNDDRPKWLREAQDLRKSQPSSVTPIPLVNSGHSLSGETKNQQKKVVAADDDRPKWLREAQDQRASASTSHPPLPVQTGPNVEIEARLARLKQDMAEIKPIATENELSDRMARLRDQDPKAYAAARQPDHSILRPQPRRTEAEEIEDLVTQMKEKTILDDDDKNLICELEERLNRLKAETVSLGITNAPFSATPTPMEVTESDSDDEADRIVKMFTKKLPNVENSTEGAEGSEGVEGVEGEEDWFCVICPEDPTLLCFDCENDKYCDRCFRECHREWAAMDHRVKKLPKRRSEY